MNILAIIPTSKQEAVEWVEQLPELKLFTQVKAMTIPWHQTGIGTTQDWIELVRAVAAHADADGFIVWAPDQSLLETAGLLQLSLRTPGKPVIVFSAPAPEKLNGKKFEKLGLKATLVRAAFLAQSDLGEVVILNGEQVLRPSQCAALLEHGIRLHEEQPLASVSFKLEFHQAYVKRSQTPMIADLPATLVEEARPIEWSPALPFKGQETPAIPLIRFQPSHWHVQPLQTLRRELLEKRKAIVWHTDQPFAPGELDARERVLDNRANWWAALTWQYAYSLNPENPLAVLDALNQQV